MKRQGRQRQQRRQRRQRGIALLAVLWVIAGAGTAVALGLATIRDGIATSRYRSEHIQARWSAEGCLAEFRARLERAISSRSFSAVSAVSVVNADPWTDPRQLTPADCTLTTDPPPDGPVDVNTASDSALLALPGFDPEVVAAVLAHRAAGRRFEHLDQLIAAVPLDLRDRVARHYAELVGRAAFAPSAWVVTAHGVVAGRSRPVVAERWVRAGDRIAIVRREVR